MLLSGDWGGNIYLLFLQEQIKGIISGRSHKFLSGSFVKERQ
jgi:hypothetical protein